MDKNIFITGGFGQDGKILSNLFYKKKIKLNIISKKKIKKKKYINYFCSDLLNVKKLKKIFQKIRPDVVLHLASNNPSFNQKNYSLFYKKNIIATKNIFNSTYESNQKAKFIFCSSSQIFSKRQGIVNENSKIKENSDYAKFRIEMDNMMQKYKKKKKINYINAILFNHDSICRNKKFLIPRIIKAVKNKKINFINKIIKENISGDFSHANDICDGLFKLIFSKVNKDKIILSSNKITNVNDIIYYLIKKNNIKINLKTIKNKKKKSLRGNNGLAKKILYWSPKKNIFIAAQEIFNYN